MIISMMSTVGKNRNSLKNEISKELQDIANGFLNNRANANNFLEIIKFLEKTSAEKQCVAPLISALDAVFVELLKKREFSHVEGNANTTLSAAQTQYRNWISDRYEETLSLMLNLIEYGRKQESFQSLVSCMNLLAAECRSPRNTVQDFKFPRHRLRKILEKLVSARRLQSTLIQNFKKYASYLDVVQNCWYIMPNLVKESMFKNETSALNYLELVKTLPVNDFEEQKMLCPVEENTRNSENFNYVTTRRCVNKVWNNLTLWLNADTPESVHKQMLIVLLERMLPHLKKPVLLTDFLMDSLDCGGAISLLALQGVFYLIQKHNTTHPNIYQKLYNMFEPEIFHTKFKSRLFYLADIFLNSTHLSENLVASFIKRLARLSLIAPPQDAVIILYFIGNLILRHSGLKLLICSQSQSVVEDPFKMDEWEPTKSYAIKSSLWEIVALQKVSIPSVVVAARFISKPMPNQEWDLSSVLEYKEEDIFEEEINRTSKMYAIALERPQSVFLSINDMFSQHWCLF